jgi:hypothetical protein
VADALLAPEPDVGEEAADELPQAARINGATPTNVTIPMTDILRLRHLSRCVAGIPECESTRSNLPVMGLLTLRIRPYLEGPT